MLALPQQRHSAKLRGPEILPFSRLRFCMRQSYLLGFILLILIALSGCGLGRGRLAAPALPPGGLAVSNPLFVQVGDRELVYQQVVDAVDDYFKIQSQRRMQLVGNIITPGRIDTFPVIGTTLLEPWRAAHDLGPETVHNTLQTIRRYAIVEMFPTDGGFLISVHVMKELEDLSQPENSTIGAATLRHDGSLVRTKEQLDEGPVTLGWIPLGRDMTLEQKILLEVQARLSGSI